MRIVLIGPPGSGKGTQARAVAGRAGVPRVSTGELLRAEKAAGTPLGALVDRLTRDGGFVPDEAMIPPVEARLAQPDCAAGFVLDGFPRTTPQARALDAWLAARGLSLDAVVYLDVPFDEIRRRAAGRLSCSNPACQATVAGAPGPGAGAADGAAGGACAVCGSPLVRRSDDRPEAVEERLAVFEAKTAPVVAYYQSRAGFRRVDASGSIAQTSAAVQAALAGPAGAGTSR
jgi:adenylate kinase